MINSMMPEHRRAAGVVIGYDFNFNVLAGWRGSQGTGPEWGVLEGSKRGACFFVWQVKGREPACRPPGRIPKQSQRPDCHGHGDGALSTKRYRLSIDINAQHSPRWLLSERSRACSIEWWRRLGYQSDRGGPGQQPRTEFTTRASSI